MGDRTLFIPPHVGDNVLPNLPFFHRLLRYAQRKPSPIVVRDLVAGMEKTYHHLISDVLAFRKTLEKSLSKEARHDLIADKEVYIGLLAPGGYEYTVGFIAILAIGAAVVPMAAILPAEEASYFLSKAQCVALVAGTTSEKTAQSIARYMEESKGVHIPCISPIASHLRPTLLPSDQATISSGPVPDMNAAALVIFTSGTTGPPRVLCSVAVIYPGTERRMQSFTKSQTRTQFFMSSRCITPLVVDMGALATGGLTFFSGVPTIYMRMMRYYEENIAHQTPEIRDQYISGARQIRAMLCGTSALPGPVQEFWHQIRNKPILTRYGATEFGAVIKTELDSDGTPQNSVGRVAEAVSLKLTDEGQILVKCPYMFSKYLFDEKATADAHDSEGYFKTGDIARREGKYYFILGRASIDIIKSGGYKISALDIEREILGLDYASEVMVVGVEDEEFGQRVAATVSLKQGQKITRKSLTLAELREDLRSRMAGYKMPTILRVVQGELPKSGTGKVQKKILGPQFFPPNYRELPEVQVWSKENTAKL
ncbi:AMP-dependent synthetase/ligase [Penicillium coprophilum]|uniref:AMP-dependent synthetase/ligase n=1 Tax=Penicillium coprophilum TaxID=36646 RepID=UPI0023821477|nr:AMP-dependent synthetase/ligase [Penicillium coprophilum]KAJ5155004.1 AMP-dependent synthetase/ligase [Penicillium coprophilum]